MPGPFRPSKRFLQILFGLVLATAVGTIGLDIFHRAGGMTPITMPPAMMKRLKVGESMRAVVRIDAVPAAGRFAATLLERIDDADYRASAAQLSLVVAPGTPLVMGTAADLRPGAVAQVGGVLDPARELVVKQAVILTGYVRVAP
jgi:hypothetical protein